MSADGVDLTVLDNLGPNRPAPQMALTPIIHCGNSLPIKIRGRMSPAHASTIISKPP